MYTPLLNERGGYESDLTMSHVGPDAWFVVTGSAQRVRDADWIRRHASGLRVTVTDQTEAWATLGLMGPRARDVLARATDADLGNAAFPYGSVREITVAGAAVRAIRVSYAGELGWELYVPAADAPGVWDALMAGDDVTPAGYYALDSLRIEKGYRAWGRELTPDDTPLQAGLGFTVRLDKPGFIGRDALLAQRAQGVSRRLLLFALDDPEAVAWGDEPIYRDAEVVGTLTSAAHGHTLGRAVAMGYVQLRAGRIRRSAGERTLRDRRGRHARGRGGLAARLARSDRRATARVKESTGGPTARRNESLTSGAGNENRDAGGARRHPGGPDHGRRRSAAAHRDDVRARAGQHLSARDTSTAGPPTPIATRWRSAWPSWRAARAPSRSPRPRRRRRPCSRRWRPAITWWRRSTPTSARASCCATRSCPGAWPWTSST